MDLHKTCCEVEIEPQNDSIRSINQLLTQVSSTCLETTCIYKIQEHLRSLKPDSYSPSYISIGPFHSHRDDLICNSLKSTFLQDFIDHSQVTMDKIVETIIPLEDRAQKFYAEPIALSSDQFIELLILDGCFTLMYMLKVLKLSFSSQPDSSWKKFRHEISSDLLLFENQLPFFLIHSLFQLILDHLTREPFIASVHDFVFLGLSDFLIHTSTPTHEPAGHHLLDFQRLQLCSFKPSHMITYDLQCFPLTATEHHEWGVSFQINKAQYALDISFEDRGGFLKLPKMSIHEGFEARIRNLVVCENYHRHAHQSEVTNFALFMQYLVKTDANVELLIKFGVIENNMSMVNDVTQIFTNIARHVVICSKNVSYYRECKKMKEFCKQQSHRWMTLLKHDISNSPRPQVIADISNSPRPRVIADISNSPRPRVIAFSIAVIIFVCLSLVRVIASIISLYK